MAVPMRDVTAESVIDTFAHGWVAQFGIPSSITTDRGSQFSSALWVQLMETWSIQTHYTTAYHPAANGLVERFHRRLKESLVALSENEPVKWFWHLPCALLSIRTTFKPDVGASPADLVYGEGLSVPGSLLPSCPDANVDPAARQNTLDHLRLEVARLQPSATSAHRSPRVHVPDSLRNASHVFVLRGGHQPSLTSPYMGPFRVVSRDRDSYRIALPGRGTDSVNISRLKPAIMADDEPGVDQPPPATPPSPPPPGRRPGIRTRVPDPTDRVTRRQVHFADAETNEQPPPADTAVEPAQDDLVDDIVADDVEMNPPSPPVASGSSSEPIRPPPVQEPPAPRPQQRFFTRPDQATFSRRRGNYGGVLNAILQRHLTS